MADEGEVRVSLTGKGAELFQELEEAARQVQGLVQVEAERNRVRRNGRPKVAKVCPRHGVVQVDAQRKYCPTCPPFMSELRRAQ